jgi:hypothetical protein
MPVNGEPDLLNAIEELGGIKSPKAIKNPGGEYDGFAGAFGRGAARRLVRANRGSAADALIEELREAGYNFDSADAFYEAVSAAVENRRKLREAFTFHFFCALCVLCG